MGDLSKLPPPERMPLLDDDVTLRDRLAMAALTGLMLGVEPGGADLEHIAIYAYEAADAMMKVRK